MRSQQLLQRCRAVLFDGSVYRILGLSLIEAESWLDKWAVPKVGCAKPWLSKAK